MAVATGLGTPGFFPGQADVGIGHHGGFHFDGVVWKPKKPAATPAVGHHGLRQKTPKHPKGYKPLAAYRTQAPQWPKAGTATVGLGARSAAKPVKAGALPVWIASADEKHPVDEVRIQTASHSQTLRTGANGMLLGITPSGPTAARGRVKVVIDYATIAKAYGGGFGSRLQLVQLPGCALTTPQRAECRKRTPIAFTNRPTAKQLTATITLGSAPADDLQTAPEDGAGGAKPTEGAGGATPTEGAGGATPTEGAGGATPTEGAGGATPTEG
ncbi:hypothetical protein ACWD48_08185, partial [Streptomyces sp. NPDC002519]